MVKIERKAYLVVPQLIEQPTWGGQYIVKKKSWQNLPYLKGKKIGQSYELYGQSKLAVTINNSRNPSFAPEFYSQSKNHLLSFKNYRLNELTKSSLRKIVGSKASQKIKKMPLLIKFTQAFGNSFQIHIQPGIKDRRWKPKPESWYFLEKGLITLGVKERTNINNFKKTCLQVEKQMELISQQIIRKTISLQEGKEKAKKFIKKHDPHQYVNRYFVKKHQLIDLSAGGIHHSWEEDKTLLPHGNIVYEIQLDVADSVSTIRSYDQGKIKDNGHLRKLNIDNYFQYLDTDKNSNRFTNLSSKERGGYLLSTDYYHLDRIDLENNYIFNTKDCFAHFFVERGGVKILAHDGQLTVYEGHSFFVPAFTGQLKLIALKKGSLLLKTTL